MQRRKQKTEKSRAEKCLRAEVLGRERTQRTLKEQPAANLPIFCAFSRPIFKRNTQCAIAIPPKTKAPSPKTLPRSGYSVCANLAGAAFVERAKRSVNRRTNLKYFSNA
jgi:hypothetical protein